MQLRFSVLARNREFSNAMRRLRLRLQPLLDAFEATELEHPIHEAILVGITVDMGGEFFEEVENNDGFFQVLAGCPHQGSDNELAENIFDVLQRTVRLCPFAALDHDKFEALFARMRLVVLNA
jgi:hypothetical protein